MSVRTIDFDNPPPTAPVPMTRHARRAQAATERRVNRPATNGAGATEQSNRVASDAWQTGPPPGRFDDDAPDPVPPRVDSKRERDAENPQTPEAPPPWASRLTPAPIDWYTTAPPKRTWLLRDKRHPKRRGVLPLGKVGQFIAAGGIGKTTTGAQLAVAVATGTPWLGCLEVDSPGRVLFVVGEEDVEECQRKLYQAAQVAGVTPEAGRIFVLPLTGIHAPMIAIDEHRRAIDAPFLFWLRDTVRDGDFRLVIIDPLVRFAGPEAEKDNAAATRFAEACESVTPQTTTTLVAHHTNQVSRKDGEIDATAGRGVTGLVDGPRWQCALTVERLKFDAPEEAERLGEVVTFRVTKSNYAPKPDPIVLRRDVDHGGALRPLDEADLERVQQARCLDPARTEKRRAREAEQGERETNEDGAVVQAVRERPGIPLRDLVKRVQAIAHCGANRAEVAIERARDRLDVREGPRKAQLHHLRGTDA